MLQIDRYVLKEADTEVKRLKEQGKRMLCMWDGSVIEKPESHKIEGLCPLVSSKAKRLNRSSKGLVFNFPPRKPVTVAAMQGDDPRSTHELVEHQGSGCDKPESSRRSSAQNLCEAMGRYSAAYL